VARDQEMWAPVFCPIARQIKKSDHVHRFRSARPEAFVIYGRGWGAWRIVCAFYVVDSATTPIRLPRLDAGVATFPTRGKDDGGVIFAAGGGV